MISNIKVPSNFYSIMKWAGIIIIIAGIKSISNIIIPMILAVFISLMLLQAVHWLENKKISRNIAILVVVIIFTLFLFLIGNLLGISLGKFNADLPQYKLKLLNYIADNSDILQKFGINYSTDHPINTEPSLLMNLILNGLEHLKQIISMVFLIMLLTIFFLLELDSFPIKFKAMFSQSGNEKSVINLNKIIINLRSYIGIKSVTSFATGLFIYLGLLILDVDYAILWGCLAFLLNYIPNIGSLIAAIPAVIFAGIELGGSTLLYTGILYFAVNFIIGSIIEPKVMGKGMGLSMAVILISLMFWGWLFGPIGMFLSVPLTMVMKVFLESNEDSKYFAILIGTEEEAKLILKNEDKVRQ